MTDQKDQQQQALQPATQVQHQAKRPDTAAFEAEVEPQSLAPTVANLKPGPGEG